jgi:hypothetical protein
MLLHFSNGRPEHGHSVMHGAEAFRPSAGQRCVAERCKKKDLLVEERRLKVTHIERTIADFERTDVDLQNELPPSRNASAFTIRPIFAAANKRSEKLKRSVDELKSKLEDPRLLWLRLSTTSISLKCLRDVRPISELTPTDPMLTPLQRQVTSGGL